MTTPGEGINPDPLQARVQHLLEGAYSLETDVHTSLTWLDLDNIKLLQPNFPNSIDAHDITQSLSGDLRKSREGVLGRLLMKVERALQLDVSPESRVEVSPTFVCYNRALRGNPSGESGWVWLEVRETSYEGWISVDEQTYNFDSSQPIIRASSNWLNEDGRAVRSGITYTYVPLLDSIATCPPQEEADASIHFIDKDADPMTNLATIVEASFQIPR